MPVVAAIGAATEEAGGAAGFHHHLLDDGAGPELHAAGQRPGPIGEIDRGLGAAHAADQAGAAAIAARPAAMAPRIDGGIDRPPMPAQPVEAAGGGDAEAAEGERRLGAGGLRRIGGIAREPAYPHHPVVQIVIGLEGVVAEGPVLAHAIQAAGAEIRGMQPRKMRRPVDRRAAHPVPHQGLQR